MFPDIVVGSLYGKLFLEASSSLPLMGVFISIYTLSYLVANFFLSIDRVWVSYLALFVSMVQIIGIWIWHNSVGQVITVSIVVLLFYLAWLLLALAYYFKNEKK